MSEEGPLSSLKHRRQTGLERRLRADTVAEVAGSRDRRKERIRIPVATNRSYIAVHRCESMLRARACKILVQQYPP